MRWKAVRSSAHHCRRTASRDLQVGRPNEAAAFVGLDITARPNNEKGDGVTRTCPACRDDDKAYADHYNARVVLATQAALARSVCFEAVAGSDPFSPLTQAALRSYRDWAREHGDWIDTSAPTRDAAAACL